MLHYYHIKQLPKHTQEDACITLLQISHNNTQHGTSHNKNSYEKSLNNKTIDKQQPKQVTSIGKYSIRQTNMQTSKQLTKQSNKLEIWQ